MDKAEQAHKRKAYEEAEQLYLEAAKDEESAEAAKEGLATLHADIAAEAEAEDAAKAEAQYREALEIQPGHDEALTGLVRLLRAQKRLDDASKAIEEASASGQCGASCNRLALIVLLEQGDRAAAANKWDEALAAYTAAQQIREQVTVAVAIAATSLTAGKLPETEAALTQAHPSMLKADASSIQRFLSTHRALVHAMLSAQDIEGADRVRVMRLADEPAERQTELALLVAKAVLDGGDRVGALTRYENILGGSGEQAPTDAQRPAIEEKTAFIYAALGTEDLHAGRPEEADRRFSRAIELQPEDWSLKLQRILALSGTIGAEPALASLSKVPATAGLAHAKAILLALQVREQLDRGEREAAAETLEKAKRAHSDLPEVRLAGAMMLAHTPSDELSGGERRALLGRQSLVTYPGEVFRFGEALAELDWVHGALSERDTTYPFTAPWMPTWMADLEGKLKTAYPMPVVFREDPEPVIVFHNSGGPMIEISVKGPDGFREEVGVVPGTDKSITIPDSGLLRLKIGRQSKVFYAEGYAQVTLTVP